MGLKTKLKASSINNLTEGRYFAAVEASWIGFNFNPKSQQYTLPQTVGEIMPWLSGPRIVGEFENAPIAIINEISDLLELDTIQTTTDLDLSQLTSNISSVIRRFIIEATVKPDELEEKIRHAAPNHASFLLDFRTNGITWESIQTDFPLNIPFLADLSANYNLLVAFPFTEGNVLDILEKLDPLGIDLAGGQEIATGLRAFDDIGLIIDKIEIDD